MHRQLFSAWTPLALASGVALTLALFPGLPAIPFLAAGSGLGFWGWKNKQKAAAISVESTDAARQTASRECLEAALKADPLAIEVGPALAMVVRGGANADLLERLSSIRLQIASQSGYLVPPVRISDNLTLPPHAYSIIVKGVEVSRFEFLPGHDLALAGGPADSELEGVPAKEPVFGLPALWVKRERTEYAEGVGYTVVDALSVIGTHFAEVARRRAHELFTRQDAKAFCDRILVEQPKLAEELSPKHLVTVQRVLQSLLREQVSVRDATSILEGIAEAVANSRNPVLIGEYVRQQIRRLLIAPHLNAKGELTVYFTDRTLEQTLETAIEHGETNSVLAIPPQKAREIVRRLQERIDGEEPAVLVTAPGVRYFLRQLTEVSHPNLTVLSHNEIPPDIHVVSLGVLQA